MHMTLRERVENILLKWRSWHANTFDAAADLGLLKTTVCDPNSLNLCYFSPSTFDFKLLKLFDNFNT